MSFDVSLRFGQSAESDIARWLRSRGSSVLPVYETMLDTHKGPRLFVLGETLIAPDLFVFGKGPPVWIEVKHKTAFAWHRITGNWVTGIDLRHYTDYCQVDRVTPWPVWLLFLHKDGTAKDSPPDGPVGLFGADIESLRRNEHHRHANHGRSGMVYWTRDVDGGPLRKLAELDEVIGCESSMAVVDLPRMW